MNRVGAFILLASVCACHEHEDTIARVETPAETTVASSPTPSASASASPAPETDADVASEDAGHAESIGLGPIGTIGHSSGGTYFGGNNTHVPTVRQGTITTLGRLPPEVIQRIVRQNFGRLRYCYETGLRNNSALAGKVVTKFVINTAGIVTTSVRDASTTLADATVVTCVTGVFSNLAFPKPEGGGLVIVTYPLIFAPSD